MAVATDLGLQSLWQIRWGKPLQVSRVTWQDAQFEFFEPGCELSKVFTVRLEGRILIREEYRVAYEYFDANANYKPSNGRAARYILTGHPGIGKTSFLAYVLVRRLSEKRPTIVQLSAEASYVLFNDLGASIFNGTRMAFSGRPLAEAGFAAAASLALPDLWALSDGTSDMQVPSTALLKTSALVIHAASPVSDRWYQWKKEQRAKLYVMDLWEESELGALLTALDLDVSRGLAVAQQYGPCPQNVVLLMSDPDEELDHLEQLKKATHQLAVSPSNYIEQTRRLRVGDEAYSLFFVRPAAPTNRGTTGLCIPTSSLLAYIVVQHSPVMATILSAMAQLPSLYMSARWPVECCMHAWISAPTRKAIWLSVYPKNPPEVVHARFYSRPNNRTSIYIDPCDKTIVGDLEALEQFKCFYWCPTQGRFAGVDAVVYVADCKMAWMFQATVGEEFRPTSEGIGPLIEELGQYGYDVQYKVLILVGHSAPGAVQRWSSLGNSLKDRYHGFDDVLSTRIPIFNGNQSALRLMQECTPDASYFTAWQTDIEE